MVTPVHESVTGKGFQGEFGKTVPWPAGLVSGETVVLVFGSRPDADIPAAITDFTQFVNAGGANTNLVGYWHKADGTETGNITLPASYDQDSASVIWRISSAADPDVSPPVAVEDSADVDENDINPIIITPAAGSADYLYLITGFTRTDFDVSTFPAGYTNTGFTRFGTQSATITWGSKGTTASTSEDPAAFEMAGSGDWSALTIAIAPAGAAGPAITDVDTDEIVADGQTNVVHTGTGFGATATGSARVRYNTQADGLGTDSIQSLVGVTWADTSITLASIDLSFVAEGVTAYCFVRDSAGVENATGFAVAREDTTAPTLTLPTAGSITQTGVTPSCSTNEANGTMYMVLVPNGDVPSVAQIKLGQQSSGAAAIASDNDAISATGVHVFAAITGLTAGTPYELYFVHTDAVGNDSAASTVGFTTTTATLTISGITGGANLTSLEFMILDTQDLNTAVILKKGNGESTDGSGNLVVDLNDVSVSNGQSVWYLIKDAAEANAAQGPGTVSVV